MKRTLNVRQLISLTGMLSALLFVVSCTHTDAPTPAGTKLSVVVHWNEAMLAAIRSDPAAPTVISRQLYLVHQAMYDAWSLYDDAAIPAVLDADLRRPSDEHNDANKTAAVSRAAYHVLVHLFPEYENDTHAFSNLLDQLGYEAGGVEDASPAGIGLRAAQAVLASREADGSNAANGYTDTTSAVYLELYEPVNSADPAAASAPGQPGFNPNRWQPLRVPTGAVLDENGTPVVLANNPASYIDQSFLTPHWGAVTPFALSSGDQFRPPAPPQMGSSTPYTDTLGQTMTGDEAYRQQVNQVLSFSAELTDYQKCIAEYWADGPRTETPPGHWNALAHGVSWRDQHTLDDDIKLYFALNGAILDASVAAWEAKRAYDFVRPVSAIRHLYAGQSVEAWGGPGRGTQTIPAESWRPSPTFVTPAFPEYVSGHSTFSAAAAEVLTRYTGSARFYDGVTVLPNDFNSDGVPDLLGQHVVPVGGNLFEASPAEVVVLQWATFQEAADEAALSRLYGGIHTQDGDRHGRIMGKALGTQAYALAERYWQGTLEP